VSASVNFEKFVFCAGSAVTFTLTPRPPPRKLPPHKTISDSGARPKWRHDVA